MSQRAEAYRCFDEGDEETVEATAGADVRWLTHND